MKYLVVFSFIAFGILNLNAQKTVSDDVLYSMINNGYSAPKQVSNQGSLQKTVQYDQVNLSDNTQKEMLNAHAGSLQTQSIKQTPKQSVARQSLSAQRITYTAKKD